MIKDVKKQHTKPAKQDSKRSLLAALFNASMDDPGVVAESTLGERMAEKVTTLVGSWRFLIFQSIIIIIWIILNVFSWMNHWDPYPFILMNLFLSLQAAYTAPLILISQNRQSLKDREVLYGDYNIDKETNKLAITIHEHLTYQDDKIDRLLEDVRTGKHCPIHDEE